MGFGGLTCQQIAMETHPHPGLPLEGEGAKSSLQCVSGFDSDTEPARKSRDDSLAFLSEPLCFCFSVPLC